MTEIIMIPLTKLVESEDNVRRAHRKHGVSDLAASIRAHGLLQSLVVRETANGRFAVIAGGRRLRALRLLAKAGDIEKNAPIPCRVIIGENAAELSLAENVVRQDMAVHEEIEAFQRLVDEGEGPEAIAARFGISPNQVARRLKLARLSPRVLDAFKQDQATLDQISALAIVDDHAAQERAFFESPDWARTPERLKAQVCQSHVPETDKLARFVGIEAYQAAGGAVVSDLFAEPDDDSVRYLCDRDLLMSLAEAKLAPFAAEVRGEGWAWVEIAIDGVAWTQFPGRISAQRRELRQEEADHRERVLAQLDESDDEAEIERLEAEIDAIDAAHWQAEEVALAGAVITLTHAGEIKAERGLVRTEDLKALKRLRKISKDDNGDETNAAGGAPARPALPAKLMDELFAHKTLALRAELARQPDLALRCIVFALAVQARSTMECSSLVRLRIDRTDVEKLIVRSESKAGARYEEVLSTWAERLPDDDAGLWDVLASANQSELLDVLAVLAAPAIVLRSGCSEDIAERLCEAAGLDMTKWWSASVESFFEHVRKDAIVEAMMEADPKLDRAALEKAPKKEALARAKKLFKRRAWLPLPLRAKPVASLESSGAAL